MVFNHIITLILIIKTALKNTKNTRVFLENESPKRFLIKSKRYVKTPLPSNEYPQKLIGSLFS